MGMDRYSILDGSGQLQVVTTGCSGTGAPVHALSQIVGISNIDEHASAEKHVAWRKKNTFFFKNLSTPFHPGSNTGVLAEEFPPSAMLYGHDFCQDRVDQS